MSTIERAQVEALAEHLRDIHFDGTGCGTSGTGGCSNCFGPSPMSAHEIAEETLEWATKRPLNLPALVSAEREADRLALAAARAEVERLTAWIEALPGEIETWRKESSDVLVEGAWSDGVRFGLEAAISIVRGDV